MNAEGFRERIVQYTHLPDDRRLELLLLCTILKRLEDLQSYLTRQFPDERRVP